MRVSASIILSLFISLYSYADKSEIESLECPSTHQKVLKFDDQGRAQESVCKVKPEYLIEAFLSEKAIKPCQEGYLRVVYFNKNGNVNNSKCILDFETAAQKEIERRKANGTWKKD